MFSCYLLNYWTESFYTHIDIMADGAHTIEHGLYNMILLASKARTKQNCKATKKVMHKGWRI